MNIVTVCGSHSHVTHIAVLLLLVYPLELLLGYRSRKADPVSFSVLAVTLAPLLLGISAVCLGFAQVMQSRAISGGGRSASAAGIAEQFALLTFASATATVSAGIAISQRALQRKWRQTPGHMSNLIRRLAFILSIITAAAWCGLPLVAQQITNPNVAVHRMALPAVFTTASLFIGAAAVALFWLFLSRRNATLREQSFQVTVACVAAAIISGVVAWRLTIYYANIALHG